MSIIKYVINIYFQENYTMESKRYIEARKEIANEVELLEERHSSGKLQITENDRLQNIENKDKINDVQRQQIEQAQKLRNKRSKDKKISIIQRIHNDNILEIIQEWQQERMQKWEWPQKWIQISTEIYNTLIGIIQEDKENTLQLKDLFIQAKKKLSKDTIEETEENTTKDETISSDDFKDTKIIEYILWQEQTDRSKEIQYKGPKNL